MIGRECRGRILKNIGGVVKRAPARSTKRSDQARRHHIFVCNINVMREFWLFWTERCFPSAPDVMGLLLLALSFRQDRLPLHIDV